MATPLDLSWAGTGFIQMYGREEFGALLFDTPRALNNYSQILHHDDGKGKAESHSSSDFSYIEVGFSSFVD